MSFHIEQVVAETTYGLRQQILRPGMTLSSCYFPEDNLPESFHLAAILGGKIVGVASFFQQNHKFFSATPQYRLRGMATAENIRGMGVGMALLNAGEQLLRLKKAALWWCNARTGAVGFYKKAGLSTEGRTFDIESIGPHIFMFKWLF